uniref:hypothetical protein n=1 Tax=Massilia oculi TaxID=945844 RepID=UPI0036D2C1F5
MFFDHDRGKTHQLGQAAVQRPHHSLPWSWLDFEFDPKDALFTRIDVAASCPVSILLRALGYSNEEMLAEFFEINTFHINPDEGVSWSWCRSACAGENVNSTWPTATRSSWKRASASLRATSSNWKLPALPRWPCRTIPGRSHLSHDVVDGSPANAGQCQRRDQRRPAGCLPQGRRRRGRHPVGERSGSWSVPVKHLAHRPDQRSWKRGRNLPHDASGRAADQGSGAELFHNLFFTSSATTCPRSAA